MYCFYYFGLVYEGMKVDGDLKFFIKEFMSERG